ncbi:MAG TPA: hypothetical protein VF612_16710 [Jatrophihabitans sp.]|uniref:hypothetical protein n=1 Tax=Jatrophihabitans sp. TaxID=1932789 RepID=UPI002F16B4EA
MLEPVRMLAALAVAVGQDEPSLSATVLPQGASAVALLAEPASSPANVAVAQAIVSALFIFGLALLVVKKMFIGPIDMKLHLIQI